MTLAPKYQITNITTLLQNQCSESGDICYLLFDIYFPKFVAPYQITYVLNE